MDRARPGGQPRMLGVPGIHDLEVARCERTRHGKRPTPAARRSRARHPRAAFTAKRPDCRVGCSWTTARSRSPRRSAACPDRGIGRCGSRRSRAGGQAQGRAGQGAGVRQVGRPGRSSGAGTQARELRTSSGTACQPGHWPAHGTPERQGRASDPRGCRARPGGEPGARDHRGRLRLALLRAPRPAAGSDPGSRPTAVALCRWRRASFGSHKSGR